MVDTLRYNLGRIYRLEQTYGALSFLEKKDGPLAESDNLDLLKIRAELLDLFPPLLKYLLECLEQDGGYINVELPDGGGIDIRGSGKVAVAEAQAKARDCLIETVAQLRVSLDTELPEGHFNKCFIAVDQALNWYHYFWPVVREGRRRRGGAFHPRVRVKARRLRLWEGQGAGRGAAAAL